MKTETTTGDSPTPAYPVAKPAPPRPAKTKLKVGPEPDDKVDVLEELLSPPSIKGFAVSFAVHAVLLLILAFWYFATPTKSTQVLDTRLAGSPFGDPSSDQLTGGQGMDTPLDMPQAPTAPTLSEAQTPTLTSLPVSEIKPTEKASNRTPLAGAANGGGVNLRNPGQGGNGDGFGVAKFGNGGENINGVDVKVGDPQFTLIWDSRADIDLHVIEPGGSEIFWENRNGGMGGELDVDDVDGFGPENINYQLNRGPNGTYRWFVHYYGGLGGIPTPTRWKVRIKHAGKIDVIQGKFSAIGQKSRLYELKINDADNPRQGPVDPKDTPEGAPIAANGANAPLMGAAGAGAGAAPAVAAPANGPRVFSPPGSGFSLTLPGEPKATVQDVTTTAGPMTAHVYLNEGSEGGIGVSVTDFPAASFAKLDPSQLLDDTATQTALGAKGTVAKTTKIALSGSAGREVEFTLPDSVVAGGGVGKARIYLAGRRIVKVFAIGTKGYVEGPDAESAFKSFSLNESR